MTVGADYHGRVLKQEPDVLFVNVIKDRLYPFSVFHDQIKIDIERILSKLLPK